MCKNPVLECSTGAWRCNRVTSWQGECLPKAFHLGGAESEGYCLDCRLLLATKDTIRISSDDCDLLFCLSQKGNIIRRIKTAAGRQNVNINTFRITEPIALCPSKVGYFFSATVQTGEVSLPVLQVFSQYFSSSAAAGWCQTGCGEEGSTLTEAISRLLDSRWSWMFGFLTRLWAERLCRQQCRTFKSQKVLTSAVFWHNMEFVFRRCRCRVLNEMPLENVTVHLVELFSQYKHFFASCILSFARLPPHLSLVYETLLHIHPGLCLKWVKLNLVEFDQRWPKILTWLISLFSQTRQPSFYAVFVSCVAGFCMFVLSLVKKHYRLQFYMVSVEQFSLLIKPKGKSTALF